MTEEDKRRMAVDILNGIDNTKMKSDGLIRNAMDLLCNYRYDSYEIAAKRTLKLYRANPDYFGGDTPTRYTYMGRWWKEMENDETIQEHENQERSVINQLMNDMAKDLLLYPHTIAGFEPTDGEGQ